MHPEVLQRHGYTSCLDCRNHMFSKKLNARMAGDVFWKKSYMQPLDVTDEWAGGRGRVGGTGVRAWLEAHWAEKVVVGV